MTVEEAEREIGRRGTIHASGENRGLLRKWLVANGFPSPFAAGISIIELGMAYNQTDGAGLKKLRDKLAKAREEMPEAFEETEGESPRAAPIASNGHSIPIAPIYAAPSNSPAGDKAAALHALIAGIAGESISPDQVSAMIESRIEPLSDRVAQIVRTMVTADILDSLSRDIDDRIKRAAFNSPQIEIKTQGETRAIDGLMHREFPELLMALSAGLHIYLPGPAGSGKTTAAEMAAKALNKPFYIQGAISGSHELLGYKDAAGQYHGTPFRAAFEGGGIICLDEIDAGDASATITINAALANGHMAFPDSAEPIKRHPEFQAIACANTFGSGADRVYVGRNQLDAATLDRFYFLSWDYDAALELAIAGDPTEYNARKPAEFAAPKISAPDWTRRVQKFRAAATREKARHVISPRASIFGAQALSAGIPQDRVEQALIWRGMDSDLKRRIESGAQ